VGVTGSESRCDLLSKIAESLQLCAMDVNWEIRDSYMELIDFMTTKEGEIINDIGCDSSPRCTLQEELTTNNDNLQL